MHDLIILGGGPAGLSAALTARNRNQSVLIISGNPADGALSKAGYITNYPGVANVAGRELLDRMTRQAKEAGAEFLRAHALSAMRLGETIGVSAGTNFEECSALILCTGIAQKNTFPGESEFLGRGVSYCATCDGMLYRGRRVAVIGLSGDAPEEAEFLRGIGCVVQYYEGRGNKFAIRGGERAEILEVNGEETAVDAVFVLRSSVASESLVPGLETKDGHIVVDAQQATNLPGIFAAGDCTGTPYQLPNAVGEGNKAAIAAVRFLHRDKQKSDAHRA